MTKYEADNSTKAQLAGLGYGVGLQHARPVLVCDVDEVVLHLVDPFVEVLQERGYSLKSHSFKLTGNVFNSDGEEASQDEVWAGLTQLFTEQAERQGLVDGVVDGLNALSDEIDIIFLTNMPHTFGEIRRAHLSGHGLDFPLVTNSGSKVPAINIIKSDQNVSFGFIDDTPHNLDDVRKGAQDVALFHFMANEKFRRLAGTIEGAHFSTGDWAHAAPEISRVLLENA